MPNGSNHLSAESDGGVRLAFTRAVQSPEVENSIARPECEDKGPFAIQNENTGAISDKAIRDELSRILASSIFVQSVRLGRFLQFTVDTTLAGRAETLKEYLIGTDVYNRPTSYRPNDDSIVRSEARRLRSKLKDYYDSVGSNDPIIINYHPGSYVPIFCSGHDGRSGLTARRLPSRVPIRSEQGIRIAVLPFGDASSGAGSAVYAQLITEELIHELVRTDGVRVSAASSVRPLIAKAMNTRSLARKLNVQILFEGTVRQDNNLLRITSRLVDPADGFQIWSERIDMELTLHSLPTVVAKIASSLVSHIETWPPENKGVLGEVS
jgi:TolB-like protein